MNMFPCTSDSLLRGIPDLDRPEWATDRESPDELYVTKVIGQCCGSGMFIPDPDFFPSRIPDPKKHGEVKKFCLNLFSYLFVAFRSCWNRSWLITVAQNLFNLMTILNYFHFLTQENIGFKLSEIMVGSGIRKKPIPDPGSRGQKGTGSRIRIRNTVIEYRYRTLGGARRSSGRRCARSSPA